MKNNMLWVDKYRPDSLDDFVVRDANLKESIKSWIEDGVLPGHMLFSGHSGTGKTTLAKLILKQFNVPKADILIINGSLERGIDLLRERLLGFCSTYSLSGGMKYILIDEADHLGHLTQPALRNFMEKYSEAVRFIFTCNHPNKIIPALHSRLQEITFKELDREEFLSKGLQILIDEEIEFEPDNVLEISEAVYPDLRKFINILQQNTRAETLHYVKDDISTTKDYLLEMVALVADKKITEARILVCSQASEDEYEDIYNFLYKNLEMWGESEDSICQALIIIDKYLYRDAIVGKREINLAACFAELRSLLG